MVANPSTSPRSRFDLSGRTQPEPHLLERFEVGRGARRCWRGTELQVRLDPPPHLALVEHLHARARASQDVVAERVERADLVPRSARQVGEPVLHLVARALVVRERAHCAAP